MKEYVNELKWLKCKTNQKETLEAIDKAVYSLEAWDKVKDDIGRIKDYYNQGARGNHKGFLYGLNVALHVINHYLEGEEQNESEGS